MSKRRKVYRIIRLLENTLSGIRQWWDEFTPEWDKEDEDEAREEQQRVEENRRHSADMRPPNTHHEQ